MSDSSSTGSTGSSGSSNSWTLINPEDAAVESVGHVDDGPESLGDVPSLHEDVTGPTLEVRTGEGPVETVLSEEGQQVSLYPSVCQETTPDMGEGSSNPTLLSPSPSSYIPLESDQVLSPSPSSYIPLESDQVLSPSPSSYIPLESDQVLSPSPSSYIPLESDQVLSPSSSSYIPLESDQVLSPSSSSYIPLESDQVLSPSPSSYIPLESDPESQAPVIHDIVTSSPSDNNDQLSATPFVTHIDLLKPFDAAYEEPEGEGEAEPEGEAKPEGEAEPEAEAEIEAEAEVIWARESPPPEGAVPKDPDLDTTADVAPAPESQAFETPAPSLPEEILPVEIVTRLDVHTDSIPALESEESVSPVPESKESVSPALESPLLMTIGSTKTAEAAEAPAVEETTPPVEIEEVGQVEEPPRSFDMGRGDTRAEGDVLRRRTVPSFEAPRRTSEEEDEEDDAEFKLPEKEEKRGFSLNKLLVTAVVLLCLGSLFLSDDLDSSEMSNGEDWANPQEMKEVFDKLEQENHQITQLEDQLQKEELDSALKLASAKAEEEGKGALEKENGDMREELSPLPDLKVELETLRSRVRELTQLTADHDTPTSPPSSSPPPPAGQPGKSSPSPVGGKDLGKGGRIKEELQRQGVLLEESRKRLEGMKKDGGPRKGVREGLSEIQKRLTEQVEKLGKRRPFEGGSKWDAKKGKDNGKDHWKKEVKKEWRGEKEWKHSKDKHEGGSKSHKQSSHKEAWRKYHDEWDSKKDERRQDRVKRKTHWHISSAKNSNHHHHHHQHQHQHQNPHQNQPPQHQPHQSHQFDHTAFWKHQEEKLIRNVRIMPGCSGIEDCAAKEGLNPVDQSQFQALLEGYLSKLKGVTPESKKEIRELTAQFFKGGVFTHDRVQFSDFAEDVADILEDLADILEDEGQGEDDVLEEAMEEFPVEALWRFAVPA